MTSNNLDTSNANSETHSHDKQSAYRPVRHHWFFYHKEEGHNVWRQFSKKDSNNLEKVYQSDSLTPETLVPTDGGRYDVNVYHRRRISVYWDAPHTEVRRCSWFYKATTDGRYIPYEENLASKLEDEYKNAAEANKWHRKVELPNRENIMFHSPDILVLFTQTLSTDQPVARPRIVKRGIDGFEIEEGEPEIVDHLLFLVHGIGSVCDLKFRSLEEVVDDFRTLSLQLVQAHYKSSCEKDLVHRVEVLPISWHKKLHSEGTGIDSKLKQITLDSIPRLRDFTNDTLLDILFYSSPVYCQTIISTVGGELNRIYDLFKYRNPKFKGNVSVGGHSLGSLIIFDLLCHQRDKNSEDISTEANEGFSVIKNVRKPYPSPNIMSRRISYMMSVIGTGQPELTYPHLNFDPIAFFALGSPIGMFVTIRGLDSLGENFRLPTCPAFFNIFHPYDPVAYRIEALINPECANLRPVLIPHHKGRKRMHLELKETMARVGADLKHRVLESIRNTWNSVTQLSGFYKADPAIQDSNKIIVESSRAEPIVENDYSVDFETSTDISVGLLNRGRRIDYVLQEAPLEFFNEYIFALTSHCCYWESEDTMLLILKEIYNTIGISADNQIPQQTMKIERTANTEENGGHA